MQNQAVNQFNPIRQGLVVMATAIGLWLLLLYPAYLIAGTDALQGLTIAAVLCTVPGILVSVMSSFVSRLDQQVMLIVVGGFTVRMLFVAAGVLMVNSILPGLGFRDFLIWILMFYMVLLSLETFLVYRQVSMNSCVAVQNDSGSQQETSV